MEFRILGQVRLTADDGSDIVVSQSLIRAAICVLLLRAGEPLSREHLMELIWSKMPSPGALRTCVYEVRRTIGTDRLIWDGANYRLRLRPEDSTDLALFHESTTDADQALADGQRRKAAKLYANALSLWRDTRLRDLPDTAAARDLVAGLLGERGRVRDAVVEISLSLGDHHGALSVLQAKTADDPLDETGWAQLMLTLYRSGRQAEAIQAYERVRAVLATEAGVEPGPQLKQLWHRIRTGDPTLVAGRSDQFLAWRMERRATTAGIDVTTPNVARIYDYLLGGKDNFAADREAAEKIIAANPAAPDLANENRAFLGRAIRYLTDVGIRQFIDIGSGLPTRENVHEVAQGAAPDSRIIYVDNDPIVLAHSRALLATNGKTVVINADMRQPDSIINHSEFRKIIDLSLPVAVLFVSVLHCLTDDDKPAEVVGHFRDRVPPGSYLVISHITAQDDPKVAERGAQVYSQVGATTQMTLRERDQILRFFDGFDLVPPGLVPLPGWHPSPPSKAITRPSTNRRQLPTHFLCGVGHKR